MSTDTLRHVFFHHPLLSVVRLQWWTLNKSQGKMRPSHPPPPPPFLSYTQTCQVKQGGRIWQRQEIQLCHSWGQTRAASHYKGWLNTHSSMNLPCDVTAMYTNQNNLGIAFHHNRYKRSLNLFPLLRIDHTGTAKWNRFRRSQTHTQVTKELETTSHHGLLVRTWKLHPITRFDHTHTEHYKPRCGMSSPQK